MSDPLLVRAGRGMVPTPRALVLRERVGQLVEEAEGILRPAEKLNIRTLVREFTLRTSDGFVENFGPRLIALVNTEAPGVRIIFLQKPNKDSAPLRDGSIDLDTGVVEETMGPEIRTTILFRDRLIGVVRNGHPLARDKVSAALYAEGKHVLFSRRGFELGPIDKALVMLGMEREIIAVVGGFAAALALARASDLIATVPERHTGNLRLGMHSFPLPIQVPEFAVSMLWHPRLDADPGHRWLRRCVQRATADTLE